MVWGSPALAEIFRLKTLRDPASVAVRRAQLTEMVRSAPTSLVSNSITAAVAAIGLRHAVDPLELALWTADFLGLCTLRAIHCRIVKRALDDDRHLNSAFLVTVILVGLIAMLWLVPALRWYSHLGDPDRVAVGFCVIGVMAAGSVMLRAVPPAAMLFMTIMAIGHISIATHQVTWSATLLSVLLPVVLIRSMIGAASLFTHNIRAAFELEEQAQLIGLLREFRTSGSEWLWELDAEYRVKYMSLGMAQSVGRPIEELVGRCARGLIDPDGTHAAMSSGARQLFRQLDRGLAFHELAVPTRDGRGWYCISGRPVLDDLGAVVGWRGVASDITALRLGHGTEGVSVARHDPLTALANRLLVREMIEEARLRQKAGDGHCTLLLLDLDRFKLINDTLGHAIGDSLLVEVAARLTKACGPEAGVGRLGGDEFAVVWRGSPDTLTLINLAERIVAAIDRSFAMGPSAIHIGVSIGIARAPFDGTTEDELMRGADLALYRAKERQRGGHTFYEPWMLAKAQAERLLENDVREAVRRGDLRLHYQPIVDARTCAVVGHEALLRWWHPRRGAIGPDVFVPIIEDVGLIHQIGDWAIREACRQAASWRGGERVAVNISVAQLTGSGLRATVEQALADSGLAPGRLELEVTESVFLGDDAATLAALTSLQALGVRLVLDDFGKGYSSFGYLTRACFAKIKLDQSFVRGAASGQRDCLAIVQSILALAAGLGVETTAEGVETSAQAELMIALGASQLQGYLFGKAVAASDIAHVTLPGLNHAGLNHAIPARRCA